LYTKAQFWYCTCPQCRAANDNSSGLSQCVTWAEAALEYAGPRADHDRAGPEYRYLDWCAAANTDYVDYGTKDIQVLHYGI